MPQNTFFLRTRDLLVSQTTTQRHFFSTLHPLYTIIFATATILAFVLLRDSRFNFHRYTQREATPTQKSARKCAATSRDFLRERLQSAFTLANQLRCIAQYHPTLSKRGNRQHTMQKVQRDNTICIRREIAAGVVKAERCTCTQRRIRRRIKYFEIQ